MTANGKLTEKIRWYAAGSNDILSVNNTMELYSTTYEGGSTGVMKFGLKSDTESSVGTKESVRTGENGGFFRYLGTGEQTDRGFYAQNASQGTSGIYSGLDGGLVVKEGTSISGTDGTMHFKFGGENTETECAFLGWIPSRTSSGGSTTTNYYVNVTKAGSGIWRFSECQNWKSERNGIGTFSLEGGTIRLDQISLCGEYSSLGHGGHGYVPGTYGIDAAVNTSPYEIYLGSPDATIATPTLEFGSEATRSGYTMDRPIALRGDVRINNASSYNLAMGNIVSLADRAVSITLDGDGGTLVSVSEGNSSPVSVIKEGEGTWTLSGTNTISGGVRVKEGTLKLNGNRAAPYTWFRFTVRGSRYDDVTYEPSSKGVSFEELGLWDKDGNRVNADLEFASDYTQLQPGQVAYGLRDRTYKEVDGAWRLATAFNGKRDYGLCVTLRKPGSGSDDKITTSDSDSRLVVVMRLPANSATVDSYDFCTTHASDWGWIGYEPKSWMMEGSQDGVQWDLLHEVEDGGERTAEYTWFATNEYLGSSGATCPTHTGGYKIAGAPTDAGQVISSTARLQVDSGATADFSGSPVLGGLVVSGENFGTISGASFGTSGTLNVVDVTDDPGEMTIYGDFEDCTGVANLSDWSVEIKGKATTRYAIEVIEEYGLRLYKLPAPTMILVR